MEQNRWEGSQVRGKEGISEYVFVAITQRIAQLVKQGREMDEAKGGYGRKEGREGCGGRLKTYLGVC